MMKLAQCEVWCSEGPTVREDDLQHHALRNGRAADTNADI
jgi:hypothetical protein